METYFYIWGIEINYLFFHMTFADIKTHLTIDQVLDHYHLTPSKNNLLNCPFHPDKTPSLQIYPKTNTAYCFSTTFPTEARPSTFFWSSIKPSSPKRKWAAARSAAEKWPTVERPRSFDFHFWSSQTFNKVHEVLKRLRPIQRGTFPPLKRSTTFGHLWKMPKKALSSSSTNKRSLKRKKR